MTSAVSKLFNPLNRIPHNSMDLSQAHLMQLIKASLVAPGVLELEHVKYLNWLCWVSRSTAC